MSNVSQITDLLTAAQDDGDIDPQTFAALGQLNIANSLVPTFGLPADTFAQNEVILVSLLIDDSGSIEFGHNVQNMVDGHNLLIDAFKGAKQQDNILWMCQTLNSKVISPWCELSQAPRLPHANYNAIHGTPLYDATMVHLASVLMKFKEFEGAGVPARTITGLVTDGMDEHSQKHRAVDVCRFIESLTGREHHILAGMGIQYQQTPFRQVFGEMGIPDKWILTPKSDPKEIRAAFQTLSQSAVRASQSAASFSQQAAGGFGAP